MTKDGNEIDCPRCAALRASQPRRNFLHMSIGATAWNACWLRMQYWTKDRLKLRPSHPVKEFAVLMGVWHLHAEQDGPVTATNIETLLRMQKSTASLILTELENANFIERPRVPYEGTKQGIKSLVPVSKDGLLQEQGGV